MIFKSGKIDIREDFLDSKDIDLFSILLLDQTTIKNISWCTDDYKNLGKGFKSSDVITKEKLMGKNKNLIKPRVLKDQTDKKKRTKEKAEVFTPSWVCNLQNNQIDELWFKKIDVFNESLESKWITNKNKIIFKDLNWKDYVLQKRLEISCGEAPYIVSRYDTVSGEFINIYDRIGILDRKIRIINENTYDFENWYEWIIKAYKSVYGFEWQGDNLLIARENLLYTFLDYYIDRFSKEPSKEEIIEVAKVISWNFFQMDGLKMVIPNSCDNHRVIHYDLFGEKVTEKCLGCELNNNLKHNGKYTLIMNWDTNKKETFVDSIKNGGN